MSKKYVILTTAFGSLEAEIIKGMLEANDIPVFLSGESAGKAIGLGVGPLAEVDLLVPEENLQEAREMLNSYQQGTDI
ncbi:MAG: DUF2007 domain-containing protein [Anaerolineales bacterium]|nr:DUF2007 domain-containing protein [Anaerolineales bacterium]